LVMPFTHTCYIRSHQFRPIAKFFFWFFVADFLILTVVGAQAPEAPWVLIGQVSSVAYFSYFLIITPAVGILENRLLQLSVSGKTYLQKASTEYSKKTEPCCEI
jgi:ubiquinol-cytochrome c reductase cytochrome b subunit